MRADIFIPVRLGSSRLSKKPMRQINGKPVIMYLIERLQNATKARQLVVCTTTSKLDDEFAEFLKKEKVIFFRGNEHDILQRYLDAIGEYGTDFIINVEGDDIFTDPVCADMIVTEFERSNVDYVDVEGVPFGLSPSGIKAEALRKICSLKKATNTETGYKRFFTETDLFKVSHIKLENELKFPKNTRLSLDYQEDLDLAKEIFKELGNDFHKEDISNLLNRRPDLLNITKDLDTRYNAYYTKNIVDISTKDM